MKYWIYVIIINNKMSSRNLFTDIYLSNNDQHKCTRYHFNPMVILTLSNF